MKSQREDGKGHWPRGKRRSALSTAEQKKFRARLRKLLDDGYSRREIARQRSVSEKTIRRWLSGEDLPTRS